MTKLIVTFIDDWLQTGPQRIIFNQMPTDPVSDTIFLLNLPNAFCNNSAPEKFP